jgi:hypothetical protein
MPSVLGSAGRACDRRASRVGSDAAEDALEIPGSDFAAVLALVVAIGLHSGDVTPRTRPLRFALPVRAWKARGHAVEAAVDSRMISSISTAFSREPRRIDTQK